MTPGTELFARTTADASSGAGLPCRGVRRGDRSLQLFGRRHRRRTRVSRVVGSGRSRGIPTGRIRVRRSTCGRSDFDDVSGWPRRSRAPRPCTTPTGFASPTATRTTSRPWPTSRALFHAARQAGVQRIVHVSITHPSISSPYGYFRGKAAGGARPWRRSASPTPCSDPPSSSVATASCINNIAWLLRRLPVFAVGGAGTTGSVRSTSTTWPRWRSPPGAERTNSVIDAVGPERPRSWSWSVLLRAAVGSRCLILRVPGPLVPPVGQPARAPPTRRAAHGGRVPRHGRRHWPTRGARHRLHRVERLDPGQRRLARTALRQRDRPALQGVRSLNQKCALRARA